MNTQDPQFQEALNELYVALTKVMVLANGQVSADQKLQYILSAIGGLSASNESPISTVTTVHDVESKNSNQVETVVQSSQPTVAAKNDADVTNSQEFDKKYSQQPDDEGFANPDLEDSSENMYYELYIKKDKSIAYYQIIDSAAVSRCVKDSPSIIVDAVDVQNSPGESARLKVLEKGILKKVGRYWEIEKLCVAKWE